MSHNRRKKAWPSPVSDLLSPGVIRVDDTTEILTLLRLIARNETVLRLENYYKGLPVSYEATILALGSDYAELRCNRYQIACLYLNRETCLVGDEIAVPIAAQVAFLRPSSLSVVLHRFQYARNKIGLRNQIRVQPEEPVVVHLRLKNALSAVQGLLADISTEGLGLYLDRSLFLPRLYQPGVEVSLTLKLPISVTPARQTGNLTITTGDLTTRFSREQIRGLNLGLEPGEAQRKPGVPAGQEMPSGQITARGILINLRPELHSQRYRLGIRFFPDERTRQTIAQFISLRQSAIIREFKTLYEAISQLDQA
ncbi:MAG TPA: hypothetical protein DEQ80_00200 [Anaerolinea thermolimosa]|uniref:PilZ domain-containing protein n=1 Tax=Anaerolinea thermolimosa TaxID=229919 RepID=A0A3D1JCN2_9CHLR|nr:protein containing PilZ domain [Anaerolinea thermolimosa]GAP07932.1 protein containing PilZ domain [Anaerolinea thermolimosa]HCE16253.1 hypothetical protein [Anaerolinea thermolimosa]